MEKLNLDPITELIKIVFPNINGNKKSKFVYDLSNNAQINNLSASPTKKEVSNKLMTLFGNNGSKKIKQIRSFFRNAKKIKDIYLLKRQIQDNKTLYYLMHFNSQKNDNNPIGFGFIVDDNTGKITDVLKNNTTVQQRRLGEIKLSRSQSNSNSNNE